VAGECKLKVTREVDGGLEHVEVKPAGRGHGRPASQRAAVCLVAEHHESEEEAHRYRLTPDALGVDVTPRPQDLEGLRAAGKRKAGIKVADIAQLVDKLKNEAKVI
jgi:electron transfer flavoprotein beta subunit